MSLMMQSRQTTLYAYACTSQHWTECGARKMPAPHSVQCWDVQAYAYKVVCRDCIIRLIAGLLLSCEVLLDHLLRDAAMFREVGIEPSAGTNRPLQCGVVHCDDTKFRAQALDPLEVVHQGPVIV